jgi:hypothetical protein
MMSANDEAVMKDREANEPLKPSEALRRAKQLISEERYWTTYIAARDVHGKQCMPSSEEAFSFCMYGAVDRIHKSRKGWTTSEGYCFITDYLERVVKEHGHDYVSSFNDHSTHNEVLAAFDEAIALAESEGK